MISPDHEVLRDAMLARARAHAAQTLAAARREGVRRRELAARQARQVIEAARLEGCRVADTSIGPARAAARRAAREMVLVAQADVEGDILVRCRERALSLRATPQYDHLLDTLEAAARRRLGADTVIERDPATVGGIRARAGSRSLDYTLPVLAMNAVARISAQRREAREVAIAG